MIWTAGILLLQALIPSTLAQGSWGPLIDFPIIPVAAYIIPEAPEATRLMFFSAWSPTAFGGERGITQFAEYNYRTGEISQRQISNTQVRAPRFSAQVREALAAHFAIHFLQSKLV